MGDFLTLGEIYQSYIYIYHLDAEIQKSRKCQENARVRCKNDSCTWSGTRSQEDEHALTCLYLKVTCPHCLVETRQAKKRKTAWFARWWFQTNFIFKGKLGDMIQFDNHIFQMGGKNHQLVEGLVNPVCLAFTGRKKLDSSLPKVRCSDSGR